MGKLVRDKIPTIIEESGKTPEYYIMEDDMYEIELHVKLMEEVQEFLTDNNVEELADIMEVIFALAKVHGVDREELEAIRKDKAEKRGAFNEKIFLNKVK